jgi:hypothetical protein
MANVDAAFGFVPIRHMSGNAPRTNKYTIATGLAENIFKGDLCIITADGVITPHSATEVNNMACLMVARIPLQTDSYIYRRILAFWHNRYKHCRVCIR